MKPQPTTSPPACSFNACWLSPAYRQAGVRLESSTPYYGLIASFGILLGRERIDDVPNHGLERGHVAGRRAVDLVPVHFEIGVHDGVSHARNAAPRDFRMTLP